MMTIKHVDARGQEYVYPTTHVNFVPADAKNCAPADSSLWRYDEDGRAYEISTGRAYVMNEHGKTVARYELSTDKPPVDLGLNAGLGMLNAVGAPLA